MQVSQEEATVNERKSHPRGERGTKTSIQEIVKRATEGRLDPRVRAWAMEALQQADWPKDKIGQAKAVLAKLRAERHYVEDPVDAEFMPSAACTLEGCQGLVFLGEDCDGLLIAYLAAIESIGIEGAVLSHSYSPNQATEHVLAAVFDGGVWHRCDPSTKQPWGEVSKPTRETVTLIPSGKLVCDQPGWCDMTSLGSNINHLRARETGDFVGVGRPGGIMQNGIVGVPSTQPKEWPPLNVALRDKIVSWTGDYLQTLRDAWLDALNAREQIYQFRARAGLPLLDPEGTPGGWTQTHEGYMSTLSGIVPALIGYAQEVVAGQRDVAWDDETGEAVIIGKPGEPQVFVESNAIVMNMKDKLYRTPPYGGSVGSPSGQVGSAAIVVGAFVLSLVGIVCASLVVYGTTKMVVGLLRERARERMQKQTIDYVLKLEQGGASHEEAIAAGQALLNDSASARSSEDKREEADVASKFMDTLKVGMYAALGLGALYVGVQLATGASKSTALARRS